MTFEQWWNDGGYLYKENQTSAGERKEELRKIWEAAKQDDYIEEMEEERISVETYHKAIDVIESGYQSKRSRLKKQLTHWIGKFMIVKAENNKLRSINTALKKRNVRLNEYMVKAEAQNWVRTMNEGQLWPLPKLENPVHGKEPMKC